MNIGEMKVFLRSLPRDRVVTDLNDRLALEFLGKHYPDTERLIGILSLGIVMLLDPEGMSGNVDSIKFNQILLSNEYVFTVSDLLQAISRLKLINDLPDSYVLFDENFYYKYLVDVVNDVGYSADLDSSSFSRIVGFLREMCEWTGKI